MLSQTFQISDFQNFNISKVQLSTFQHFEIPKFQISDFQSSQFQNFRNSNLEASNFQISNFQNSKFQNFKFKFSRISNFGFANFRITRLDFNLGVPKKHKVATKTILYERYGEILFQKVASGCLVPFVQDGSSKNAL